MLRSGPYRLYFVSHEPNEPPYVHRFVAFFTFGCGPAGGEPPWAAVLDAPELKLHLYGKVEPRPGRKMGHLTVLGDELDTTLEGALRARGAVGITDD